MLKSEIVKKIIVSAGLAILVSVGSACAAEPKVIISDETQVVIQLQSNGDLIITDAKGNRAQECRLCSPDLAREYGNHCEKLDQDRSEVPICGSLTQATVRAVETLTILSSHKNPPCKTYIWGGNRYVVPAGCAP